MRLTRPTNVVSTADLPGSFAGQTFSMTGPGVTAEAGHLPVRGDLAHISLVGRVFVPHYAVPMPHLVVSGTELRRAAQPDADVLSALAAGAKFDVLDMAGGWCWGQMGDGGCVGYVPQDQLQAA